MKSSSIACLGLYCIVLLHCLAVNSFILRVTPRFTKAFIQGLPKDQQIIFIYQSKTTPVLQSLLTNPLLKFDKRYTYVEMEWGRRPDEIVSYEMKISSENLTIMAQPTATVPPNGTLNAVLPSFEQFNTTLPCLGVEGTTFLRVVMFYNVTKLRPRVDPNGGAGGNATMNQTDYLVDNYTMGPLPTETSQPDGSLTNQVAELRIRKECAAAAPPSRSDSGMSSTEKAVIGVIVSLVSIGIIIAIPLAYRYRRLKVRHDTVTQQSVKMKQDLVVMNRIIESNSMKENRYSGYSGYTRGLSETVMDALTEEEVGDLMEHVRKDKTSSLEGLLVTRDQIIVGKEIGKGAFGRVFVGKVMKNPELTEEEGTPVAIKTLKMVTCHNDVKDFLEEVLLMKDFKHNNVVTLIGVCLEGKEPPMVCLEYMQNGDLRSYLRRSRGIGDEIDTDDDSNSGPQLEPPQLVQFCENIARGMAYLEEQKFVHRDLAARNCMLNSQLIVKVGDFGLARDIHEANYYRMGTARRLPVKWMAIESLQDQIFTTQSDVWSYGVVMWEVFSLGQTPYQGVANDGMPEYLCASRRMARPDLCPQDLYPIMHSCWSITPSERPSFKELVKLLNDYKDSFYANMPLKAATGGQEYQNINPAGSGARHRTMSHTSGGYSHAGSVAAGVGYMMAADGQAQYSASGQVPHLVSGVKYFAVVPQYSNGSQISMPDASMTNPGYQPVHPSQGGHVVYVQSAPPGARADQVQMLMSNGMLQNNGVVDDSAMPYSNTAVNFLPLPSETSQVAMGTSVPPPPPMDGDDAFQEKKISGGSRTVEVHL